LRAVAVADLHHQRVEVDDRVDRIERARLPRLGVIEDGVGDRLIRFGLTSVA
jgi:hypothetical protein